MWLWLLRTPSKTHLLLLVLALRKHWNRLVTADILVYAWQQKYQVRCAFGNFLFPFFFRGKCPAGDCHQKISQSRPWWRRSFQIWKRPAEIFSALFISLCVLWMRWESVDASLRIWTASRFSSAPHSFRPNCCRRSCGSDSRKIFPKKGAKGFFNGSNMLTMVQKGLKNWEQHIVKKKVKPLFNILNQIRITFYATGVLTFAQSCICEIYMIDIEIF